MTKLLSISAISLLVLVSCDRLLGFDDSGLGEVRRQLPEYKRAPAMVVPDNLIVIQSKFGPLQEGLMKGELESGCFVYANVALIDSDTATLYPVSYDCGDQKVTPKHWHVSHINRHLYNPELTTVSIHLLDGPSAQVVMQPFINEYEQNLPGT